ncbi:hypothetical protein CBM2599_B50340 [Cupriavidus taiwanensis]|nr:hypothetical protein CBM2600_B10652 [Cupriavidus taiwanensis]SOY96408.1 hypothetical protein CBM2599_B50340 [Cupriavidus taiwanensis]
MPHLFPWKKAQLARDRDGWNFPGRLPGRQSVRWRTRSAWRPTCEKYITGIKDSEGRYIASLYLNVDATLFRGMASLLELFVMPKGEPVKEKLTPTSVDAIREPIDRFATSLATTPQALRAEQRRDLMQKLKEEGYLDLRRSIEAVSHATAYNDAR